MNVQSSTGGRVSDLWRGYSAAATVGKLNNRMAVVQRQIAEGRRLFAPSDSPAEAAIALQLRKTLETRAGYEANLHQIQRFIADAEQVLGEATDLIRQARTLALGNLDTTTSPGERDGAATVIESIQKQLFALANRQFAGVAVFGGDRAGDPYAWGATGVRFVGGERVITNRIDDNVEMPVLVAARDSFGTHSPPAGTKDLAPLATLATRLSDLGGSRGDGVARGVISIVNAGSVAQVDLTDADTLGDVVNRINASGIGVSASIVGGNAIQISGASVTVAEAGSTTAADLGLLQPAAPTITGSDLRTRIGALTPLANLNGGAGIDPTGISITVGAATDEVDLAGLTTVGQLIERLNRSHTGVAARVSDDGRAVLLTNPTQGPGMHIRENGGTTAADLGFLTFTADDLLSDLNGGRGVRLVGDGPHLRLTDTDSVSFDVDLAAAATVQDVVDAINAAAGGAGSPLEASFDAGAPGLVLTGVQRVMNLEESRAAQDLGLAGAPLAGTLIGEDVNPRQADGVFGHLEALISSLRSGDVLLAEQALVDLERIEQQFILQRGQVGGQLQEIEARLHRIDDHNLVTREMLSRLEDADFSVAVMEWEVLQMSLRASLQTTGQLLGISLFDFLR